MYNEKMLLGDRERHIAVMRMELDYLYEVLEGSESKAEKLVVQKQAMNLWKHLQKEIAVMRRVADELVNRGLLISVEDA